jgi:hypothetical protein
MQELKVHIYSKGDLLPEMTCRNYFHSAALFHICEQTPRLRPYMVVVKRKDGTTVSHMLAMIRYRSSLFPPYLYMHCRVYGEGEYEECEEYDGQQDELFGMMLESLTHKLQQWTLYIEVSELSSKMFGYRRFRQQKFFPVHWMQIHNSLHSRAPQERISEKMMQRIEQAQGRGARTKEVETEEEFRQFMRLLRSHHWLKPKRYIPDDKLFYLLWKGQNGRLFVTKYHNRVIGCCACAYSEGNAYMWYTAFRRKSYLRLHPDEVTVWHALQHAYEQKYEHMRFMDAGLPFRRNSFREFILSFGGKPVSTYRWFRCNVGWVNRLLSWIYKD